VLFSWDWSRTYGTSYLALFLTQLCGLSVLLASTALCRFVIWIVLSDLASSIPKNKFLNLNVRHSDFSDKY
jgi:Na+/melibiose symporter-like transporter